MRLTSSPVIIRVFKLLLVMATCLLGLAAVASASQISVCGYVWGTWEADTVLVTCDIQIPPDNDLTIMPGVKVLFDGPWQFEIQQDAKIVADGTPTERIIFKPLHDGDTWRGVRMDRVCGLSILDYCEFKHAAVAGSGDSANGGAIYLNRSSLAIYHCTFDSCSATNGGAIACTENSSPLITDGIFLRNSANSGGGILIADSSRPLILACTFYGNHALMGGGAIQSNYTSETISQSQFGYNFGEDGCIRIWGPDTTMLFKDNLLTHDSSRSVIHISDMGPWSAEIRNNEISSNEGVAIFAEVASPLIEGNTIMNNGEGLDLWYSVAQIRCNVIRDNRGSGIDITNQTASLDGPTIYRNIIDRNNGGGLIAFMTRLNVEHNWITRNRSRWFGGIRFDFSDAAMRCNVITGNISDSMTGGMMSLDGGATLSNCVVYGNLPDTLQILAVNFEWSVVADSCDIQGGWPYGTGNIDIDPQFRDTAHGDFFATSEAITTLPLASCGNSIPDSMEIWINPNATSVDDRDMLHLPADFELAQNYPNPFNPSTTISFSLPHHTHVRLDVFNTLGQLVRSLCDELLSAGTARVVWDGRDNRGNTVSSGVYMYRLQARDRTLTRKMLLLK